MECHDQIIVRRGLDGSNFMLNYALKWEVRKMKTKYQFISRFRFAIQPIKKLLIYTIIFQLAFPVPHVYAAPIEVDPSNKHTHT